ncbi:MAG: phosphoadenosine phosphosulfate reductase family protein, partial [Euryarchaeota archaeon]|nr:phosphoadenosine phosphosulfate reductase family protein [Euryarchaeota archaeon]
MLELQDLENRSIYIIREAYAEFENPAVLWSMGKDSTTALALCRKAFFGKIPFPVIHIDTGYKFKQMYEFRDRIADEWGLDLIIARNEEAIKAGVGPKDGKFECCTALKTEALKKCLAKHGFDALLLAIRRD